MSEATGQIVAMGGGGFSMEPENPLLDQYVLRLARGERAARPRVCFLGTASGDAQSYIDRFYAAFAQHACEPSHLSLYSPPQADLRSYILERDILYVGGGSTKNLMALWREWGLDGILHEAWEHGVVLAGISAGANCWFTACVTDSIPGPLTALPCLGYLRGSFCPHYDGEPERRPAYQRLIAAGALDAGFAADDGAALHFTGESLERVVSSRPQARAFRVERSVSGEVNETALATTYLGAR